MTYNLKQKAGREQALVALRALCEPLGARVIAAPSHYSPRVLDVRVIHTATDVIFNTAFDGRDPCRFLMSWVSPRRLAPDFAGVNASHRLKATWVAYDIAELFDKVQHGLTMAATGEAFAP